MLRGNSHILFTLGMCGFANETFRRAQTGMSAQHEYINFVLKELFAC